MNHGSLFSGIGGFDLAAEWMGWTNVFQVEWDSYCQKVLKKNFKNVELYGDIKEFKGEKYRGTVDIISGGFPCQPFSHAGKRRGEADDRHVWPEMLRIISEVKPSFVVGENVAGLISMENGKTLERIFADLENEGYTIESFIIPACSIGAWHRRNRIWIIAYSSCSRRPWDAANETNRCNRNNGRKDSKILPDVPNTNIQGSQGRNSRELQKCTKQQPVREGNSQNNGSYWEPEPDVGRVANGISNRVDRLKGLGNAIVPQIAFELFKAIEMLKR